MSIQDRELFIPQPPISIGALRRCTHGVLLKDFCRCCENIGKFWYHMSHLQAADPNHVVPVRRPYREAA
jgi:hypothetical protein